MAVWHFTKRPGLATRIALALTLGLLIALAGLGAMGSLLALVFAGIGAAIGWGLARAGLIGLGQRSVRVA